MKISYDVVWEKVYKILEKDDFKGWDPYDALTTKCNIFQVSYYTRLIFFYFNKFSPVNFRNLFRIEKRFFTQPLVIIGLAHLNRNQLNEAEHILDLILKDSKITEYGYHCWDGLDMPIQMIGTYKSKGSPNIISTEYVARFILKFLQLTNHRNDELIAILESIENFLMKQMLTEYNSLSHFRYYHVTPNNLFVFNSNANICAFLAEMDNYLCRSKNKSLVNKIIQSIVDYQDESGYWNYSVDLITLKQKNQVDFHQGFILDSILRVQKAYGLKSTFQAAYTKGLEFFKNNQFNVSGWSYYRLPKKYPVNIHNQSQGIITFTNAAENGYGEEYLEFASKIANWTIDKMFDNTSGFHYLKYPLFSNKIPYIRWSNANMLLALSYLENKHTK